jgi:signal transduction histidine kinase
VAIVLAGAGAALAAGALTFTGAASFPLAHAGLVGWISLSYVLCGVVAARRRPDSPFGTLLIAAGFTPLLSRLTMSDAAFLESLGQICRILPVVAFAHVFLAYPTGRLRSRPDRPLVIAAYIGTLAFGFLGVAADARGATAVADIALGAQRLGTALFALTALGLLAVRVVRGSTRRRILSACFVLALAGMATGLSVELAGAPGSDVARVVAFGLIGAAPILLVAGQLRPGLGRVAVTGLLLDLGSELTPSELETAVGRALRDPTVEIAYWLPEFGKYVDVNGSPVELPGPGEDRSATPIFRDGARVAALVHDPTLCDEPELLAGVTVAAGIAVENARLHAELRARVAELKGSRARIVEAGQQERQRIERNLHDGAQQRLVALSLDLRLLRESLNGAEDVKARLDLAGQEIATSLSELRDVARGIHPAVVTAHGLEVALEQLAARAPVPVRLTVKVQGRLPERLEVVAFYLVSESLANVGKHAGASSVQIDVDHCAGEVVVQVMDDGVGGADTERGSGLRGLADRVEALDGRLRVWSPKGGGTRVRAEIPCAL